MKKILSIFIMPLLFSFVACSDNDEDMAGITIVSTDNLRFTAEGGEGTIRFTAEGAISVSVEDDWVIITSFSAPVGGGEGTITFEVDPHTQLLGRDNQIIIRSGSEVKTVAIRQGGIYLDTDDKLSVYAREGRLLLDLNTTGSRVSFQFSENWARVANDSRDAYLVYQGNNSTTERTGTLTIKTGEAVREVEIVQSGLKLEANDDAFYLNKRAGQTSIEVTPNIGDSFVATTSDSWFTVSSDGDVITVTADENTSTTTTRTGTIRVSYSGQTGTIEVIQPHFVPTTTFLTSAIKYFNPNKSGGIYTGALNAVDDDNLYNFADLVDVGVYVITMQTNSGGSGALRMLVTDRDYYGGEFLYDYKYEPSKESDFLITLNFVGGSNSNGTNLLRQDVVSYLFTEALPRAYKIRPNNWSNPTEFTFIDIENSENWYTLSTSQFTWR